MNEKQQKALKEIQAIQRNQNDISSQNKNELNQPNTTQQQNKNLSTISPKPNTQNQKYFNQNPDPAKNNELTQTETKTKKVFIIITATIIYFTAYSIFVYLFCTILSLVSFFVSLIRRQWVNAILTFLVTICCMATVYIVVWSLILIDQEGFERSFYIDVIIFYLTTMLAVSYVKVVCLKNEQENKQLSICKTFEYILDFKLIYTILPVFQIQSDFKQKITPRASQISHISITESEKQKENELSFYSFELEDYELIKTEYKTQMEDELQLFCEPTFLYFAKQSPEETENGHTLFVEKYLKRRTYATFFILLGTIIIKVVMILLYFWQQEQEIKTSTIYNILITTVFYGYLTFVLNQVLGRYDLKEKAQMMQKLSEAINYRPKEMQSEKLLDITSPESLETWDNSRKFVFSLYSEKLTSLEWAYICLFGYLIFVSVICISAYGEFYWIADKDAVIMQPLMVIQFSIDFVFLNLIFLFRIYEGSEYNDSSNQINQSLNFLLDMIDDMEHMFDKFFTNKIINKDSIRNNIYKDVSNKIKEISKNIITSGEEYLGIKYKEADEQILRMKIVKNIRNGLKRIQKQNNIDSEEQCYRFLNFFKVDFTETLIGYFLALFPFLPNIIPKLIEFYNPDYHPDNS